ncbi:unnamed protein product [Haemonchus placei]|uniref:Uncharacterized protein n=1 Tax=Haemonchus placei TaxID=6290 RepID=A0A0N4WUP6_HAEPC|nr:unnamed protein product [Haemonchus placei]
MDSLCNTINGKLILRNLNGKYILHSSCPQFLHHLSSSDENELLHLQA